VFVFTVVESLFVGCFLEWENVLSVPLFLLLYVLSLDFEVKDNLTFNAHLSEETDKEKEINPSIIISLCSVDELGAFTWIYYLDRLSIV